MQGLRLRDRKDQLREYGLTLRQTSRDDEALRGVPMFRSVESALQFVYTWRATDGVKASEIKEFCGREGGMMLSASEKKAQAGLVLDVIASHLSRDQQAVLDAQFGGEQGERCAAIDRLTCLFESANRNRTLVRMTLMREFVYGERYCPSQVEVARECGVNQATVSRVAAKIAPAVEELRESAIEKLEPAFQRRGWIPR
jgi:Trp operon repressor